MSPASRPVSSSRALGVAARGGTLALSVALAFALAGMLHYLAARYPVRRDVSRAQFYGLSEKTLAILENLEEPVEVLLFFEAGRVGYADIENLLREYAYRAPRLRVSRVDPDREPARARRILETYPVTRANAVIVSAAGGHRVIDSEDLFTYDLSRVPEGGRPAVAAFRGEQQITSALHGLLAERRPVVYVLEGHGQRPLDSYESRVGLAELARRIRQDNVDVRPLRLAEERAVPEDGDVLVLAGPRRRLSQPEVDVIAEYLQRRGGRLLALLDAQTVTGIEPLLLRWGVKVGDDVVVDPTRTLTGRELFVQTYGAHPITEPLRGLTCIFTLPRSIEPVAEAGAPAPDRPVVTPLAMTSAAGWAESDPDQRPMVFDEGADRRGPVSVAVAVEKGLPPELGVPLRPARMVVVGDSFFAANDNLVGANADFLLSALHWMMDRPELIAISPQSTAGFRLALTARQVRSIGVTALMVPPVLAALLGGLVAWRRKR